MDKSCPNRLFQRLTLLAMFALVFSFVAPAATTFGEELDTSGETQQELLGSPESSDPEADDSDGNESEEDLTSKKSVSNDDDAGEEKGEDESEAKSGESEGDEDESEKDAGEGSNEDDGTSDSDNSDNAGVTSNPANGSGNEGASGNDGLTEIEITVEGDLEDTEIQMLSLQDGELMAAPAAIATTSTGLQPVVDTPENVVGVLVGTGITYSNIKYVGAPGQLGTFTGGDGIIGFPSGILMGTGYIVDVVGPNDYPNTGTDLGRPGDPGLTDLAGQQTYDAAILSFDFVPTGNMVEFNYVFSSEEYNEYVGDYNDVFAFYVNGHSCATVGGKAVSVNSINNDSNSHLFIDNTDGHLNTEMDGLTVVLTCQAPVKPGETNTMLFKIADARDGIFDSNVFLQAKSFTIVLPDPADPDTGEKPGKKYKKYTFSAKPQTQPQHAAVTSLPETGSGSAHSSNTSTHGMGLLVAALGLGVVMISSKAVASRR